MSLEPLRQWVRDRHDHWCAVLAVSLPGAASIQPPACAFYYRGRNAAGRYNVQQHACVYVLPYAVTEGREAYDEAIAHEVAHAYVKRLAPYSAWHGDLFMYVMRTVMGFTEHQRCHNYNVASAKKVGEMLRLIHATE